MSSGKVLVTGANGFLGRHLCREFTSKGFEVLGTARRVDSPPNQSLVAVGPLSSNTNWLPALKDVDAVVHTAAIPAVKKNCTQDELHQLMTANVDGTKRLAIQAAESGVKRIIFVSSLKVLGESTENKRPFTADDVPNPCDAYGFSKLKAEIELEKVCNEKGIEYVVIRPPLIYGPNMGGNFLRLVKLIESQSTLPLGVYSNKRSFVSVNNVTDFISHCITDPLAANQIFLVSDGFDVSTGDLLKEIGRVLNKTPRLIRVPNLFRKIILASVSETSSVYKVFGSLQVDIRKNQMILGWTPKESFQQGLRFITPEQI